MKQILFFSLALVLSFSVFGAKKIPPVPRTFILDESGILDSNQKYFIFQKLKTFEKSTGSQMAVAIFSNLENEDFEDFVNRVFREWKLGKSKKNDGVLLAVSLGDRRYKTEVGYGLEGILTDAYTSRTAKKILVSSFREKKYAEGIEQLITAYQEVILSGKTPEETLFEKKGSFYFIFFILFFMAAALQIFTYFSRHMNITSTGSKRRHYYDSTSGGGGGWWWGGGGFGGGSGFGGGGFGDGGGFTGGGGSSGGGGASGSW